MAGGWEARWEHRWLGACELTAAQPTKAPSASLNVVGPVPSMVSCPASVPGWVSCAKSQARAHPEEHAQTAQGPCHRMIGGLGVQSPAEKGSVASADVHKMMA